jgi:prefoldin subunit 5
MESLKKKKKKKPQNMLVLVGSIAFVEKSWKKPKHLLAT